MNPFVEKFISTVRLKHLDLKSFWNFVDLEQ